MPFSYLRLILILASSVTIMSTLFVQHQSDALPSPMQSWVVKGTDQAIMLDLSNWNPYGGGVIVKGVGANIPTKTLTVLLDSPSEGSMMLWIPVNFMNATIDGAQTKFTVLVDGKKITYETVSLDNQGLMEIGSIPYTNGTHQIDIIGTQMIGSRSLLSAQQPNSVALSPLRQFQAGVSPVNVKCNEGFVLMIKSSDGLPACLKPQSAKKLMERAWGIPINSPFPIPINPIKSHSFQNNSSK